MLRQYGRPGQGAIEYARQFVEGKTFDEAREIVRKLLTEDPDDPRIKRCAYCGYPYRDMTKPNNSKTCSLECKIDRDTARRAEIKRRERKPKPRDYGYPEGYYFWLEYPFWNNLDYRTETAMQYYTMRHENQLDVEAMDKSLVRQTIYGPGNRQKPKYIPGYEDDVAGREFNRCTIRKMRG